MQLAAFLYSFMLTVERKCLLDSNTGRLYQRLTVLGSQEHSLRTIAQMRYGDPC